MKAVVATGYGPPETYTVGEVPVPVPGPGQLQVRIAAASVNPADIVLPGGAFRDSTPLEFPHVPGNDFAGTVSRLGAGVTGYRVGDEIFGQSVPRALRAMAGTARPPLRLRPGAQDRQAGRRHLTGRCADPHRPG